MTASPITFWFDFASGYAFFAAREIEALGARVGRPVLWRPFLLGTAFRVTGGRGLSSTPLKQDYARRDWQRLARRAGIVLAPHANHPAITLPAARAFYWIDARDPDLARRFARDVFDSIFTAGLDGTSAEAIADQAAALGIDRAALLAGLADPALKEQVKRISEEAVAGGVFGSPFFVVDGEPFWGADRMGMMEEWIRSGGW